MNTLSPKNGNGKSVEKQYVDQIHNEIVEINQRLDTDEANILSNSEDVAYAIAKNNIQDSRLEALENKQDYDINRLDVNTISGDTINATTITTTNFQTDTITAESLDLNGTLNVDDIDADTIDVDTLTSNGITSTSVNAETADFGTAEIDAANIADLTSTNVLTTDITASGTANVNNIMANKLVTTDATTGTTELTSIKFRNEQLITDLPNAFKYIKIPIIQNGYYGIEYISSSQTTTSVNITVPNDGTVMSLKFSNGDRVIKGQTVLIVESMKMEVEIKASETGTITYAVASGDEFSANQVLATINDVAVPAVDPENKESFSVMVYQNNGTVMVSYSQNDVNVLHKFYYDSINKNLWIETTNDIDSGIVKWSSADTETHNLAEFYRDITIDVTQKEVFGQLVKRLHGWVLMGNHTVSYGMDIMGGLTADLLTPSQFLIPFQRFYPEGTPIEAIYTDLLGNLGVGRFETSGYYGTALNKVEALNRVKVEENKITWTLDTDYGWDNIIWENWGQTETTPYDIGLITTSNVWDRAVNDPFEPVTITLTLHNTVDGTTSTLTGFNFITLSDIPETGYLLQGFATEDGGTVVYNVGDRITEDTELWTVYQRLMGYIYNSETDPNYNPADTDSPYWNDVQVLHLDNVIEAVCPEGTTRQTITFTVETDADLASESISYWLNGYCDTEYDPGTGGYVPGGETASVTEIEDGVYEISWTLSWNYYWEAFTPGESYPIAGFGCHQMSNYFSSFETLCNTSNLGTYFKVRDDYRIEDI